MAAASERADLGSKLRAARERSGVTLRQIADSTKISINHLEALERNDVSRLPGGVFGRGWVRAFALEVGLDPEETVAEFLVQFPQEPEFGDPPVTEPSAESEPVAPLTRLKAWKFLPVAAVGVPALAVILYLGMKLPKLGAASSNGPAESPRPSAPPTRAPERTAVVSKRSSALAKATTGASKPAVAAESQPTPAPAQTAGSKPEASPSVRAESATATPVSGVAVASPADVKLVADGKASTSPGTRPSSSLGSNREAAKVDSRVDRRIEQKGGERAADDEKAPEKVAARPEEQEPPVKRLAVILSVTRPSWVLATVDGNKIINRLVQVGEQEALNVRRDLILTAGDAGAVVMTLNGAEARPLGPAGEVVTARVNRSNFKTYLPSR